MSIKRDFRDRFSYKSADILWLFVPTRYEEIRVIGSPDRLEGEKDGEAFRGLQIERWSVLA